MALYSWNSNDFCRKVPSVKLITRYGQRKWDSGIEYKPSSSTTENHKTIFTMPSFSRHGRWGNRVFQYIFMRVLALKNNGEIELYRTGDQRNTTMCLYDDTFDIPNIQTKSNTILLDSYHLFPGYLNYFPSFYWRAMFVSNVRKQKCFILKNADEVINEPLGLNDDVSVEVEGLFMVNPRLYKQYKEFILSELFRPNAEFNTIIQNCVQQFGQDKTIIGIHIRKGDFIREPLKQPFQIPIPVKFIIEWLVSNISQIKNPVIFVCSDDSNAYKSIEMAGFEVFHAKKLIPENGTTIEYEQLDWELLRQCDTILSSNSSFSFSAAFLSSKKPRCYQFSFRERTFIQFDPWESEPLQFFSSSPYLGSYLYSRFILIGNMLSKKAAYKGLFQDINKWIFWKLTKPICLYYIYGFSSKFIIELFNLYEFFQLNNRHTSYLDYDCLDKMNL